MIADRYSYTMIVMKCDTVFVRLQIIKFLLIQLHKQAVVVLEMRKVKKRRKRIMADFHQYSDGYWNLLYRQNLLHNVAHQTLRLL